jgi:hypothetical protein
MTSEISLWSHIALTDASLLTPMSNAETDTRRMVARTTPCSSSAIVHLVNRRDTTRADMVMATDTERRVFRFVGRVYCGIWVFLFWRIIGC